MAVKTINSAQMQPASDFRKYPIDDHGKLRFQHALAVNTVDAGDAGTVFNFFIMPPSRVRVIPYLSRLRCSAFGAARTLSIGHGAYSRNPAEDLIVADPAALASGIDVSAAATLTFANAPFKFDMYSKAGIQITGTLAGGTVPVGGELELMLAYLYE